MKKNSFGIILFSILIVVVIGFLLYELLPRVSSRSIVIHEETCNPANLMQKNATVAMGTYGQELFFYTGRPRQDSPSTSFSGYLAVFRNNTVEKLAKPQRAILTIDAGYCYYFSDNALYAMRLSDLSVSKLHEIDDLPYLQNISSTGQLLLQNSDLCTAGYPIHGDTVGELTDVSFSCGDELYSMQPHSNQYSNYFINQSGAHAVQQVSDRHYQFILSFQNNLYLIDIDNSKALFRLNPGGTSDLLFSLPCGLMDSAFNFHGNTAFFSCQCYARSGDNSGLDFEGIVPYRKGESDPSGTYRINLTTGEIQKVSDSVYNGLYIFDDSGIYACDQKGKIYLLDFDGNVIDTLVKN